MRPKEYIATDHDINPEQIDPDALLVLERLKNAGHTAYLVGGSVRDLLIRIRPKDVDISTSATPEEIKAIFRRQCILIGRRFRLAHIRFGKKIIEVSTFRKGENEDSLIIRDNEWGSPEEDVLRRDFTINGLFYDPTAHSVIDYVGGWEDIHKKILRAIGDPDVRFKQDPVRMIRLLKFHARLKFKIEAETEKALLSCREEITKSSPARLLEEMMRMLESGYASPFIQLLSHKGFLKLIFPSLDDYLGEDLGKKIFHTLHVADQMQQDPEARKLRRSVLISCLLFPIFEAELQKEIVDSGKTPHLGEIQTIAYTFIKEMVRTAFSHFPRKITSEVANILTWQYRLNPLSGKIHFRQKLLYHRDFSLSLQLLKIRSLIDQENMNTYLFWQKKRRQFRDQKPVKKKQRAQHVRH